MSDDNNSKCAFPCPRCGGESILLYVFKDNWCICEACKIRWREGRGIFSSYRHQTCADWERAVAELRTYAPAHPETDHPLQPVPEPSALEEFPQYVVTRQDLRILAGYYVAKLCSGYASDRLFQIERLIGKEEVERIVNAQLNPLTPRLLAPDQDPHSPTLDPTPTSNN